MLTFLLCVTSSNPFEIAKGKIAEAARKVQRELAPKADSRRLSESFDPTTLCASPGSLTATMDSMIATNGQSDDFRGVTGAEYESCFCSGGFDYAALVAGVTSSLCAPECQPLFVAGMASLSLSFPGVSPCQMMSCVCQPNMSPIDFDDFDDALSNSSSPNFSTTLTAMCTDSCQPILAASLAQTAGGLGSCTSPDSLTCCVCSDPVNIMTTFQNNPNGIPALLASAGVYDAACHPIIDSFGDICPPSNPICPGGLPGSQSSANVTASACSLVPSPSPEASPSPHPMPTQVLCPGMPAADYCDCGGDCTNQPSFCACGEARQCCAAGGFGVGGGNSSGFPDLQQLCTSGLFSTVMQLDPAWTSATMASYEQCICGGGITAGMLDGSNPAGMITALCSNPCVGMFPDMVLGGVRASLGDDSPISSTATDAELRTCMCSGSPPVIVAMASDSPDLSMLSAPSCAPATTIRQVGTVAIAAGDVSDYTPTVVLGMRQNVANLVGAPLEAVTIAVASASVEITITITATEEQLAEGLEAHRAALSDPAQLSTILSTPSFPVTVTEVSQPPTMLTPEGTPVVQEKKDNSLEVGVIVAIVAGIIVLLVVSCALAAYCGKPTNKQPTTVVQMTDIEKTSHPVA